MRVGTLQAKTLAAVGLQMVAVKAQLLLAAAVTARETARRVARALTGGQ